MQRCNRKQKTILREIVLIVFFHCDYFEINIKEKRNNLTSFVILSFFRHLLVVFCVALKNF